MPKGRAEGEEDSLSGGPAVALYFLGVLLYCRKEGNECTLSVQELVHYLGVELEAMHESLQNLEQGGFIKLKKDCNITDASSFLSCAVLGKDLKHQEPDVPRP